MEDDFRLTILGNVRPNTKIFEVYARKDSGRMYHVFDVITLDSFTTSEFGNTVSIDLTLSEAVHAQHYHKNLRYAIRKARETGLVTSEDHTWAHADDFVAVYQETMARCGSRPEYIIDRSWVNRLDARGAEAGLGYGPRRVHPRYDPQSIVSPL